jgi:hypothetical protein
MGAARALSTWGYGWGPRGAPTVDVAAQRRWGKRGYHRRTRHLGPPVGKPVPAVRRLGATKRSELERPILCQGKTARGPRVRQRSCAPFSSPRCTGANQVSDWRASPEGVISQMPCAVGGLTAPIAPYNLASSLQAHTAMRQTGQVCSGQADVAAVAGAVCATRSHAHPHLWPGLTANRI